MGGDCLLMSRRFRGRGWDDENILDLDIRGDTLEPLNCIFKG
jgi:hypothetical protein